MRLWSDGGSVLAPESGIEIKVDGQTAMARKGAGNWDWLQSSALDLNLRKNMCNI